MHQSAQNSNQHIAHDCYCLAGHYVVVCGYDRVSDHYLIRDPDPRMSGMGLCCISRPLFNAARKAFGTDEDLLLISAEIA